MNGLHEAIFAFEACGSLSRVGGGKLQAGSSSRISTLFRESGKKDVVVILKISVFAPLAQRLSKIRLVFFGLASATHAASQAVTLKWH